MSATAAASTRSDWGGALCALRAYAVAHPAIRMDERSLSVPADLRGEFYGLVERAQLALARDVLGGDIEDVAELAGLADEVRRDLIAGSDLEQFRFPSAVEALVQDPARGLAKPAFGLVLDALQTGMGEDELARRAERPLKDHAALMRRCAFESWAYYGVVRALRPVRFWEIFSPNTVDMQALPTGTVIVGEQVTSPERRMPEAVFECADGRCFAMKSELARELDFYGTKIRRRRDMSLGGNSANHIAHRVLLLYRIAGPHDVPLIADRDHLRVRATDLTLEFLTPADMAPGAATALFLERLDTIPSKRATCVLTEGDEGDFPEVARGDPRMAKQRRVVVGRDRAVLDALARELDETEDTEDGGTTHE